MGLAVVSASSFFLFDLFAEYSILAHKGNSLLLGLYAMRMRMMHVKADMIGELGRTTRQHGIFLPPGKKNTKKH